jgi:hypothetical protein
LIARTHCSYTRPCAASVLMSCGSNSSRFDFGGTPEVLEPSSTVTLPGHRASAGAAALTRCRSMAQCRASGSLARDVRLTPGSLEEVRIMSEAVREESQCVRRTSAALRAHAAGLMERGTTLVARMAQLTPSAPEEIRQAESGSWRCSEGDTRRGRCSGLVRAEPPDARCLFALPTFSVRYFHSGKTGEKAPKSISGEASRASYASKGDHGERGARARQRPPRQACGAAGGAEAALCTGLASPAWPCPREAGHSCDTRRC